MGMEHSGKELRRLRNLAGLSQYELSNLCGIRRNRLSLSECGYRELQDEEYEKAERALRRVVAEKHRDLGVALSRGGASCRQR
jgi:transcriptional regulator with XRE-family HTH domain